MKKISLDKDWTNQLKGIAIILVIFGHQLLLGSIKCEAIPKSMKYAGAWGVAIFLILSGFGLVQSYLSKGIDRQTLQRRLTRVVLPFFIVTTLWLLYDLTVLKVSYPLFPTILGPFGLDFSRSVSLFRWFTGFIILWYLVFYIVFKMPIKDSSKIVALFLVAMLFKYYSANFDFIKPSSYQWRLHAFAFPIGALFGMYFRNIPKRMRPKALLTTLGALFLIAFSLFYYFVVRNQLGFNYYSISNILFAIGAISGVAVANALEFRSRALIFLGSISYELYILEAVFARKFVVANLFESQMIGFFFFIATSIVVSLLLKKLVQFLTSQQFCKKLVGRLRA